MITTFISFEIQKYLLHSIDASFPLLQKRKTSCKLALTNIKIFNFADQIVKKIPLYKLIYELCGNFDSKKHFLAKSKTTDKTQSPLEILKCTCKYMIPGRTRKARYFE